jgi:uncharacterized OB-fold protein
MRSPCLREGQSMSEIIEWQGYFATFDEEALMIQSPFTLEEKITFGSDSDYTTMTIAGLHLLFSRGIDVTKLRSISLVNAAAVKMATGVDVLSEEDPEDEACEWNLLVGEEATLVFTNNLERDLSFHGRGDLESLDPTFAHDMAAAWEAELQTSNVSQGAYVSEAAYMEGAHARLSFMAQNVDDKIVWPPRQMDADGQRLPLPNQPLMASASVESWTKLSAAGAPSEFALRAPVLGGIQTVFVRFEQGPCGVFLIADDEDYQPQIGDQVTFVVRRIYAQEGFIRYGMKAVPRRI